MTITEPTLRERIEDLLREGPQGACERERTTFDRLARPYADRLVLFGCGGLGRRTLAGLRAVGIEPLAFSDSNPAMWGQYVEGVAVFSPRDAAAQYGQDAVFVVTVWGALGSDRMRERIRRLRDLGCGRVCSFGELYWKYSDALLPHYGAAPSHELYGQEDAVLDAAGLWADRASQQEYLSQIRWRLFLDFDGLADPVTHPIYFPDDLCRLAAGEIFVDCGAYDGDTVQDFLQQPRPGSAEVVAFEPDPANFAKLRKLVETLGCNATLHQAAVGAINGDVSFSADGTAASAVGHGDTSVQCLRLDDALGGKVPTWIKMDIEGAELEALEGARRIISNHSPVLAISAYHRQDHVWRIPRLIRSFNPDYHFFLRPHHIEMWDLVCYAIPGHRLRPEALKP